MKAVGWTTWERYLPSIKLPSRTGTAALCLKPWDHILPEEGVQERLIGERMFWRSWEKYLPLEKEETLLARLNIERAERALI